MLKQPLFPVEGYHITIPERHPWLWCSALTTGLLSCSPYSHLTSPQKSLLKLRSRFPNLPSPASAASRPCSWGQFPVVGAIPSSRSNYLIYPCFSCGNWSPNPDHQPLPLCLRLCFLKANVQDATYLEFLDSNSPRYPTAMVHPLLRMPETPSGALTLFRLIS